MYRSNEKSPVKQSVLGKSMLAVSSLVLMCSAQVHSGAPTDDVAVLSALDHAMQKAVVDGDARAFGSFLSDDYLLVVSNSRVHAKAAVVAEIGTAELKFSVNESSNLNVRVHGDTAVIIADLHQVFTQNGKPADYWVRYTDTWVRSGGQWQCVSGHATRLQKDAPAA